MERKLKKIGKINKNHCMHIAIKQADKDSIEFVIDYCLRCDNKSYSNTEFQRLKHKYLKKLGKGKYWCFIAQIEDRSLGYIDVETKLEYGEKQFWVNELYVNENNRCKGIATKLINYVMKFARKMDFKYIFACTESDNIASKKVLKKAGYISTNVVYKRKL